MKYKVYNAKINLEKQLPEITVHGRFQPPLHIYHWLYISKAFDLAKKVRILITNPKRTEKFTATASHRGRAENNPFSYSQRVKIFQSFFKKMGIDKRRYEFTPFDIRDKREWKRVLSPKIANLINIYGSQWNLKKFADFKAFGLPVIEVHAQKEKKYSGTKIREVLKSGSNAKKLKSNLIQAGYMPQAIDGLFKILKK